jgi:NADP-dependent 3-hydroxy acid dehydrogenase YdfG
MRGPSEFRAQGVERLALTFVQLRKAVIWCEVGFATAALVRGAELVLVGRSAERLRSAAQELGATARVTTISADVTDQQDVAPMFDEVGALDHLVVTSGFPRGAPIAAIDLDDVRALVEVLMIAAISLVKHAQGQLRPLAHLMSKR